MICPSPTSGVASHTQEQRDRLYKAFGYTYEDVKTAILPMAQTGAEPTSRHGHRHPAGRAVARSTSRCSTTSSSSSPRSPTRPSTPSVRKWSPIPRSMWAPTATCCEEGEDNCRALQIENPILTSVDLLKIKQHEEARLPGGDRLHALLQEHPTEAGVGSALCGGGPGVSRWGQHHHSVRPGRG